MPPYSGWTELYICNIPFSSKENPTFYLPGKESNDSMSASVLVNLPLWKPPKNSVPTRYIHYVSSPAPKIPDIFVPYNSCFAWAFLKIAWVFLALCIWHEPRVHSIWPNPTTLIWNFQLTTGLVLLGFGLLPTAWGGLGRGGCVHGGLNSWWWWGCGLVFFFHCGL